MLILVIINHTKISKLVQLIKLIKIKLRITSIQFHNLTILDKMEEFKIFFTLYKVLIDEYLTVIYLMNNFYDVFE